MWNSFVTNVLLTSIELCAGVLPGRKVRIVIWIINRGSHIRNHVWGEPFAVQLPTNAVEAREAVSDTAGFRAFTWHFVPRFFLTTSLPFVCFNVQADCLVPMVVVILEGAATFDDVSLRQNIGWLYPAMCSLMQTNSPEVRTALQTMFATRVRSLLHI